MSFICSMLMSVDGYVEDEHGRFDWAAPAPMRRCIPTSTSSRRRLAPTSTGEGWSFCGTLSVADRSEGGFYVTAITGWRLEKNKNAC
jgi:hypothetical protein